MTLHGMLPPPPFSCMAFNCHNCEYTAVLDTARYSSVNFALSSSYILRLAGAGKPKAALSTVKVATCMGWVLVLVYLAILIPGDSWLGSVFFPHEAPDSKTRETLRECIWLVAAGAVGDWTNCVLSGALQVRVPETP